MPRQTLAALALGLALPTAALADETPVPPTAWANDYLGTYAVDGACDDTDKVWILTEFQVDMGDSRCTAFGKMTFGDDGLEVPMSQCRQGAVEIEDRRVAFAHAEEGEALSATMDGETLTLTPCPGATPIE